MALALADLKTQTNVTGTADDAILTRLLAAATAHVASELGFAIDDEVEFPDGTPADLEQAVLMVAAHWYENREGSLVGVTAQELPMGVADIIRNHRSYTYG
jgi:hypothetical protein